MRKNKADKRGRKTARTSRGGVVVQRMARRMAAEHGNGITTANGLLYQNGHVIHLPEADSIAIARGHMCAEQLVRQLEREGKINALHRIRGINSPSK